VGRAGGRDTLPFAARATRDSLRFRIHGERAVARRLIRQRERGGGKNHGTPGESAGVFDFTLI